MGHEARVLLLVAALAASACLAEVQVQTVYINKDENWNLKDVHKKRNDVLSCEVTNNNGTKFMLWMKNPDEKLEVEEEKISEEYKRFKVNTYELCSIQIYRMTDIDSGNWKLNMTYNTTSGIKEKIASYNVKVRTLHGISSTTQKISVYPNQTVSLRFHEKFNNLESCKLLSPENIEYDLSSEKLSEIRKSEKCAAKMIVKPDYYGVWTLVAELANNVTYTIAYDIKINDEKNLHLNRTSVIFKRGEKGTIEIGASLGPKICIFEDPYGFKYPIVDANVKGLCTHEIPTVLEYHEGIWKVHYGLEGYQNLVPQEINLQTYEEINFNSSVVQANNGDVSLLCQVHGKNFRFCSFVRPDGQILHMTYGVGNSKYEYYGNGLHIQDSLETRNHDCGITIHRPSTEDYGSWRCLFKFQSSSITGRILKVTPPGVDEFDEIVNPNVTTSNVYARRGDAFKVKCQTEEMLKYCWLRSPNGTVFSVSTAKVRSSSATILKYEGAGLELGECGASVEAANSSDVGQWSCHMGVVDGPEIHGSFNVFIEEMQLMAVENTIPVASKGETNLTCQPLAESNQLIESCRWINPAGYGINVDNSGRYVIETKATHCKLSIRAVNLDEDAGEWWCYARFVGGHTEEQGARMEVTSRCRPNFANANLSLILGILLCSGLAIGLVLVHKIRLRSKQADEEIILEKSNNGFA